MTATVQVSSIRIVDDDLTECRICHVIIDQGRRVAFVVGVGNVCLRCLIIRQTDHEHPADLEAVTTREAP